MRKYYPVEPKKPKLRKFLPRWDEINDGYIPIDPTGSDIAGVITGKRASIGKSLRLFHYPYRLDGKQFAAIKDLQINDYAQCTKLDFLLKLLEKLQASNQELNIAIVTSSLENEKLLEKAMNSYKLTNNCELSTYFRQKGISLPFYGVLVQFPLNDIKTIPESLKVDCVLVYDSSLIAARQSILKYFQGVKYSKPQMASLACVYTPDIRVCNYRDANPRMMKDPKMKLNEIKDKMVVELFTNITYKRPRSQRTIHNEHMLGKVRRWIIENKNNVFKPLASGNPLSGNLRSSDASSRQDLAFNFDNKIDSKKDCGNDDNKNGSGDPPPILKPVRIRKRGKEISKTTGANKKQKTTIGKHVRFALHDDEIILADKPHTISDLKEEEENEEENVKKETEYAQSDLNQDKDRRMDTIGNHDNPIEISSSDSEDDSSDSSDKSESSSMDTDEESESVSSTSTNSSSVFINSNTHASTLLDNNQDNLNKTASNNHQNDISTMGENDIFTNISDKEATKEPTNDMEIEESGNHVDTNMEANMCTQSAENENMETESETNLAKSFREFNAALEEAHSGFLKKIFGESAISV